MTVRASLEPAHRSVSFSNIAARREKVQMEDLIGHLNAMCQAETSL